MDVVYLVKSCERNEELRYSLRTLTNIPHVKVFMAGYMPSWVNPETVIHIPVFQSGSKYQCGGRNLRAAARSELVGDKFLLFNDDFFILKPVTEMPQLRYMGTLDTFIQLYEGLGSGHYVQSAKRTRELLSGLGIEPLYSYELHTPLLFEKRKLLEVHELHDEHLPGESIHIRTLYGNYHRLGGQPTKDVKVYRSQSLGRPYNTMTFLSSSDYSFKYGDVGRYIRRVFNEPSVYEKPNHYSHS